MQCVSVDGTSYALDSSEQILPPMDPLQWLESQSIYPKVYWKEKGAAVVRAAVGSVIRFSQPPCIQGPQTLRVYGGQAFRGHCAHDLTWQSFPESLYWLPALELSFEPDHTVARSYAVNGAVMAPPVKKEFDLPRSVHTVYTPSYALWQEQVTKVLERITQGCLHKVVLARKTSVTLDKSLDPCAYLSLMPKLSTSTLFLFQLSPYVAFLGATPELLFKKQGKRLITEAVAGTRKRGVSPQQDLQLEQELFSHPKERQEFHIVKEEIARCLASYVHVGAWLERDLVLKSSHVQHLYNRFEADLNVDLSVKELLSCLHPTPALGGFPKEAAGSLIAQLEPFDRGWYGAPIGVISSEDSAFYVAIRSMLWQQQRLDLFSGAGIVAGSCPVKEWEELNAKLGWFYGLAQPVHER